MMDHAFVESMSQNPRYKRSCAECSRIPEVHIQGRDEAIERLFMADVGVLVQQIRGMSFNPGAFHAYTRMVAGRLELGETRYGAIEFLSRDNLVEVSEETPDCSAYGILEVERLQREGLDEELLGGVRAALVTAAAYAAIADEYVRVAKLARAGKLA